MPKSVARPHRERAAAALREQQRQEARRRNLMVGGVVGVLVVAVVAGFLWMRANDSSGDIAAPAAGSEFSVIRPENATGNFVKIAQRVPVRIAIDPGQVLAERLSPGMSVVVSVDTAQR